MKIEFSWPFTASPKLPAAFADGFNDKLLKGHQIRRLFPLCSVCSMELGNFRDSRGLGGKISLGENFLFGICRGDDIWWIAKNNCSSQRSGTKHIEKNSGRLRWFHRSFQHTEVLITSGTVNIPTDQVLVDMAMVTSTWSAKDSLWIYNSRQIETGLQENKHQVL